MALKLPSPGRALGAVWGLCSGSISRRKSALPSLPALGGMSRRDSRSQDWALIPVRAPCKYLSELGTVLCEYLSLLGGDWGSGTSLGLPCAPQGKESTANNITAPSFHPPSLPSPDVQKISLTLKMKGREPPANPCAH